MTSTTFQGRPVTAATKENAAPAADMLPERPQAGPQLGEEAYLVEEVPRAELFQEWLAAADKAMRALVAWRGCLIAWRDGGSYDRKALRIGLSILSQAGLEEWVEWCPVQGGLDVLAAAMATTDQVIVVPLGGDTEVL